MTQLPLLLGSSGPAHFLLAGVLLLGLCCSLRPVDAIDSAMPRACVGTQKSDFTMSSSIKLVSMMRNSLAGCQYIIGDLHIIKIREQEFIDNGVPFDLSFLDSIQEITGCIKIVDSCFTTPISFKSLQVIRGRYCDSSAITVHYTEGCTMDIPPIDFRSLRYIGKGNVEVGGLKDCFIEKHVDFTELFADNDQQAVHSKLPCYIDKDREPTSCHPDCPKWSDGERHCWGPGSDQCQRMSKCRSASSECPSSRCYLDSDRREHCCSENCLGGCFGPTSKQCYGCTGFNNNGTCVSTCSPTKVYDHNAARLVDPLEKFYPLGPICVTKCPSSFFVEEDSCVSKCTTGYSANSNKTCVKVQASRHCEADGDSAMLCGVNNPLLVSRENSSQLCTEFTGDITLIDACFNDKPPRSGIKKLKVADLFYIFSRLSVVRGTIYVTLRTTNITNLAFFAKLQKIDSNPNNKGRIRLQVASNYIQYLGMSSLRYVSGSIVIVPEPISKLKEKGHSVHFCPNLFPKAKAVDDKIITHSVPFPSEYVTDLSNKILTEFYTPHCPFKPDRCHDECDASYGCWGPFSDHCVRCMHAKAGSHCVSNCTTASGWFDDSQSRMLSSKTSERVCSRCSSLCSRCFGPEENECTDCVSSAYRDDTRCVKQCARDSQFSDSNRVCQTCPKVCLDPRNGAPTCTGNGSFIGFGGCQLCSRVTPEHRQDGSRALQCLSTRQSCPDGLFLTILEQQALDHLTDFPDFVDILKSTPSITSSICLQCADPCLTCTGAPTLCTKCRYFQIEMKAKLSTRAELTCTSKPQCPSGYFAAEKEKLCKLCSASCSTCYGPTESECLTCAERMYTYFPAGIGNSTEFICVSSCPESQPRVFVHDNYGMTCSNGLGSSIKEKTSVIGDKQTLVVIGVAIFCVILILLIVSCYWFRQRSHHAKKSIRNAIIGDWDEDMEPLNVTDTAPNVAVLRTISEKELVRGQEVGSGAFGTVFRGEWLPEGETRKVSVAIKILSDSLGDCNMSSELLEESRIMASVEHPHCVRIVGICMTQPLQLITQFMPLGNLRDFLRARKDGEQIGSSHLLRYAAQIASGMSYLEKRSIIHRDLACRNVLVASAKCVKITDFGLAKLLDNPNEEYKASGGKLPVKWLALECLMSRKFSHKSDVWAFGVTLWEIFMFGEAPYVNVKPNDLADYLEKGERLPQPPICTLDVYILMIKCWMLNESQRPAFDELEVSFRKMAADPGRYVYIKGDKYARNPSHESGSIERRSVASKSPSVSQVQPSEQPPPHAGAVSAEVDNCSYSSVEAVDDAVADNDVFNAARNSGDQSSAQAPQQPVSIASTSQEGANGCEHQPQLRPKGWSQHKYMNVKRKHQQSQQQPRLSVSHNDNKYTSDPCKQGQGEEHQLMLPPPRLSSISSQSHQAGPSHAGNDEGYLRPIEAGDSAGSWQSPSPPLSPPRAPPSTSTVQNPEYFFNASRMRQYQNFASPTASQASGAASPSSSPAPRPAHPLQLWVAQSPTQQAPPRTETASTSSVQDENGSSYV